jgi:hypothetical protein
MIVVYLLSKDVSPFTAACSLDGNEAAKSKKKNLIDK